LWIGHRQALLTGTSYDERASPRILTCRACADIWSSRSEGCGAGGNIIAIAGIASMKKALPEKMFIDDQSRLSALRTWVLEQGVTEIEMSERQFWNFAGLQPLAEKPWVTFMGRQVRVPNMPEDAQKCLGVFDPQRPGVI
jgi:hypothetical protein